MPPRGGARRPAQLTYDADVYTPAGLKAFSEKELRAEYSRLRSIARKRLERFETSEYADSNTALKYRGKLKPLPEIKSASELRHLLTDAARLIESPTGSVRGKKTIDRKRIETLQARGYDFINKGNLKQFGQFMQHAAASGISKILDSEQIYNFWKSAKERQYTLSETKKLFDSYTATATGIEKMTEKVDMNAARDALKAFNIDTFYSNLDKVNAAKKS